MSAPVIPSSSIPAARAWLLAQLQATLTADPQSPASELLVCDGEPGPWQPDDIVYLGDVHQTYSPHANSGSGGAQWLTEDYTVTVHIDIFRGGDNPVAVFARARALADAVVAVVRADPSLGGAVDRARPASATHATGWEADHKGRTAAIELHIDCLKVL
ncbi:hypothetical protein ACFC1T_02210 [Kitasatospora sp. NPDC056076]|uniref:hypothetical protein n=1 Tax=Kitasatospora sp. NPDC056076 TaxID=3345703 RepID=UPI0035DE85A1